MRSQLADFSTVDLYVWPRDEGLATVYVQVVYVGNVSDLLSAGVTTAAVLAKRPPKGPRPPRLDDDGEKLRINHWHIVSDGVIVERAKVVFPCKQLEDAMKLPGVRAAWARQEQETADQESRKQLDRHTEETAEERREALYRAEELATMCLRRMPEKGFATADEAQRFLGDLRDMLRLAPSRRGARSDLAACLAEKTSLSQAVRALRNLPTYEHETGGRTERPAQRLRLVVDNTR